ncbi:MAG: acyltransferase domain-containing protein, partial [Proteobacteria bacterium]|nr:acyltransferase domain-containing protein [Pseudomonadota bacterium]
FLKQSVADTAIMTDIRNRFAKKEASGGDQDSGLEGVAIVGMAIRVPGADSIDKFWENLCNNVESITRFTKEELTTFVDPEILNNSDYVFARGLIDDVDKFDATFFGINPNEAKLMDPQQKIFLQLCWAALENAGYSSDDYNEHVGVFADVGDNHYYTENVLPNKELVRTVGKLIVEYGNMKDYIASRVSYCLDLKGPGVNLNSACSGALTAIDGACKSLHSFESDIALAGGIDITIPQKQGFLYQKNGTFCKDGHCRPFDAEATGTMFCDGAGVVVLKRLSDAVRDRDRIYALIKSTAINNDGGNKVSFLAPSVEGQSKVIAMAQAKAGITPDQISYIEAHGTGTPVGDPIEVEGLTKAFRAGGVVENQFCFLGSVKGHIGHPTNSSGVVGTIKTALSLFHEKIPGTLHYRNPNPNIDFSQTPFKVTSKLSYWKRGERPRLAGISSFGFGGTNVHAILGEAPLPSKSGSTRPCHLLPISAKTSASLERSTLDMKQFFASTSDISMADASYTMQVGRKNFSHRRFIVAESTERAVERLDSLHPGFASTKQVENQNPKIVFMFPGQGAQYINMGQALYEGEPLFKEIVDNCAEILIPFLGDDIRVILYADKNTEEKQYEALKNTFYTQPIIFVIEYALAKLWMSWGIHPSLLIGHSVGEFVCAVLSGMFRLEDALELISLRGRLISNLPHGSMLSVRKSADDIEAMLTDEIQLAASNGPELCVVSGPEKEIVDFSHTLDDKNIINRPLHTSHAFHSAMMDSAVGPFIKEVGKINISSPSIPFFSTISLSWINEESCTDAEYWGNHMRQTVRFSEAISELQEDEGLIFLEVGPRNTLTTLARQHRGRSKNVAVNSLPDNALHNSEWHSILFALGTLWANGSTIDWRLFNANEKRHRIPLPTYSFEKSTYWVEAPHKSTHSGTGPEQFPAKNDSHRSSSFIESNQNSNSSTDQPVRNQIRDIISEIYGISIKDFDDTMSFLEMGMDSLFLTQLAYSLGQKFQQTISYSDLMDTYPNIELLEKKFSSANKNLELESTRDAPKNNAVVTSESSSNLEDIFAIIDKNSFSTAEINALITAIKGKKKKLLPFAEPPHPGAQIGRDQLGNPGWFAQKVGDHFIQYLPDESGGVTLTEPVDYDPFEQGHVDSVIPVTESQFEIWLSCHIGSEPASCAYNESISLKLEGKADIELLIKSIQYTLNKHESLRLTISPDGKQMLINDIAKGDIEILDLLQ